MSTSRRMNCFVNRIEKRVGRMKCKDCIYVQDYSYEIVDIECYICSLTRRVMNANKEHNCSCYNRDLSGYDICYNCKYYIGGCDWGLFCSHKDMYHHLGKFSDEPCERYERKERKNEVQNNR